MTTRKQYTQEFKLDAVSIHWPEIDEDLSVAGLLVAGLLIGTH